jgi:hypothetical protein
VEPEIIDSDVSKLYRDALRMGNGKVNFDTFFLAANEITFFVKHLFLEGVSSPPILDHTNEIVTGYSIKPEELDLAK